MAPTRRDFLRDAALVSGFGSVAGCVVHGTETHTTTSGPIAKTNFSFSTSIPKQLKPPNGPPALQNKAIATFNDNRTQVVVLGKMVGGDPHCTTLYLKKAIFTTDNDLNLMISEKNTPRRNIVGRLIHGGPLSNGCASGAGPYSYRTVISTKPERIKSVHVSQNDGTTSNYEKTFNPNKVDSMNSSVPQHGQK